MTDPLAQIAEGLVVRPGDKLVIRCHRDTTRANLDELADSIKERWPDVDVVVLAGVEQIAVVRADD